MDDMYKYIGLLQEPNWYDQPGLSDGFRLNGNSSIKFLAQFYGLKPPTTQSLTIADYLTRSSSGEPRVGQRTIWERVELVVEEMQHGRISKVRIAILPLRERRGGG
jgi:CBS domain containing-hemolysin-like protein